MLARPRVASLAAGTVAFLAAAGVLGYWVGQIFTFGGPGSAITAEVLLASVVVGVIFVPFWVVTLPVAVIVERLARRVMADPDEPAWRPPGFAPAETGRSDSDNSP